MFRVRCLWPTGVAKRISFLGWNLFLRSLMAMITPVNKPIIEKLDSFWSEIQCFRMFVWSDRWYEVGVDWFFEGWVKYG